MQLSQWGALHPHSAATELSFLSLFLCWELTVSCERKSSVGLSSGSCSLPPVPGTGLTTFNSLALRIRMLPLDRYVHLHIYSSLPPTPPPFIQWSRLLHSWNMEHCKHTHCWARSFSLADECNSCTIVALNFDDFVVVSNVVSNIDKYSHSK